MIILTLKERQLIDQAIFNLGDPHDIRVWREWKEQHPDVKIPPGRDDDGTGRMPNYVIEVVMGALTRLERSLEDQINSRSVSPAEAAGLCNDILEIQSTAEALRAA